MARKVKFPKLVVCRVDAFDDERVEVTFDERPSDAARQALYAVKAYCKPVGSTYYWKVPKAGFKKLFGDIEPEPAMRITARRSRSRSRKR